MRRFVLLIAFLLALLPSSGAAQWAPARPGDHSPQSIALEDRAAAMMTCIETSDAQGGDRWIENERDSWDPALPSRVRVQMPGGWFVLEPPTSRVGINLTLSGTWAVGEAFNTAAVHCFYQTDPTHPPNG